MNTTAYGASSANSKVEKLTIQRRDLLENDVAISVLYCGICHSDIHTANGDWGLVEYPCVPGHEIVGEVQEIGSKVSKFKVGELVGVGCMVNSCGECEKCASGNENYCDNVVWTYASKDTADGTDTKGGYSEHIVVNEDFVVLLPAGMDPAKAAPLLCAGITMYSPLRHWKAGSGVKVGIIGVGGLGHMGIKLAAALGSEVYAITTNSAKADVAKSYGANKVLVSTDQEDMARHSQTLDLIVDTAPGKHDLAPYLDLLVADGSLVLVGPVATQLDFNGSAVMSKRRSIAGSCIGSVAETAEMLAFCAKNDVYPEIEIVSPGEISDAWQAMVDKRVDHRYVIDVKSVA